MSKQRIDRREFVRQGSAMVACAAAGCLLASEKSGDTLDPTKIVNYSPKMHYRRLGKSNLVLSEVSLGGHWKNPDGGRWWNDFANDEVPAEVAKNRTDVVSACIDAGINYLDITVPAECCAYGIALKGRREKMIIGADDHHLCPRDPSRCNIKALVYDVETCLGRLRTDYLDIWRVMARTQGGHTDAEVGVWIEAFQKLCQAGKVKHFGMSTHNRPWAQHVVEIFPELEMVIFPCTAKTKEKGKPPTKDNVEEVNPGYGADETKSVFQSVREKDVGLVTIKPFAGGHLFKTGGKFPVLGVGSKMDNDLARLTLQCILTNDAITATVPGLTTIYEVENAVRASYERPLGITPREQRWLARITDECWKRLPGDYAWLRDWEIV
jgi:aryl-alcohol dehydrogenase-like predicted oxidoreductase